MKKLKSFILTSLLLAVGGNAIACGPWYYSAADNEIYRILSPLWKDYSTVKEDFATRNIMLWSRQTGCRDLEAIRNAVYEEWDNFDDWKQLLGEMKSAGRSAQSRMTDNAFCRHLVKTNDTSAVRLLYWSKEYSNIRDGQRSPWYYNSHIETDDKRQLRDMYEEMLRYRPAKKYADRYTFLAIKCAWALGEDSAVMALWKKSALSRDGNHFNFEAGDYVARSLIRMGREKEAEAIYLHNGDYAKLIPYNASTATRLGIMLKKSPNAPQMAQVLQKYLSAIDQDQAASYPYGPEEMNADSVLMVVRTAIDNPNVRRKAMWRYAAACILDYKGRPGEALSVLEGADETGDDEFLRNSVRILTFYLRSKTDRMDDDYERYALGEVRWMDEMLQHEWGGLPDSLKHDIRQTMGWNNIWTLSNLYSYSALRRIMLADSIGLAWRMAGAGRAVRALQLANVADNRIFQLSDNPLLKHVRTSTDKMYEVYYCGKDGYGHSFWTSSLKDTATIDGCNFSFWWTDFNMHDYSNGLFVLADVLDARSLAEYRDRQLHPLDETDRWLNDRGYTVGDYWEDIVGTHYLRECDYRTAASHLQRVSPSYQRRMNISCSIDPFAIERGDISYDSTRYKLHYALRMDSLKRVMLHGSDCDQRGLAMLEYSIGLENSFDMCWWLTSYQKGYAGAQMVDIGETLYAKEARSSVRQLRQQSLGMLRSNEAQARYYLRLGQYDTVRRNYANTATGMTMALQCDGWSLYYTSNEPIWTGRMAGCAERVPSSRVSPYIL